MKYTGINCEYCGNAFTENDDVVVCPRCGAPHHRECWQTQNHCVHEEEHEKGYEWVSPLQPEEKKEPITTDWRHDELPDFTCSNGEKAVLCPKCGAVNYANDIYCMRCHQPLKENKDAPQDTRQSPTENGAPFTSEKDYREEYNRQEADFRAQIDNIDRFGGVNPDSLIDGIPVREYSDYVGGNKPGRIIRKAVLMERFGRKTSFCLPALILSPIWFFYRKMKKEALAVFAAMLVLGVVIGALESTQPLKDYYHTVMNASAEVVSGEIDYSDLMQILDDAQNIYINAERTPAEQARETAANVLEYIKMPGIPIACCLFAIPLYRKKAKKEILEAREENYDMDSYRRSLIEKGGTSAGYAILGVLLYFVITLVSVYLPLLLSLAF